VLRENLEILIGRTLRKNIPFFADFAVGIEKHIKHEFRKSKVVRMTRTCILTSVNLYNWLYDGVSWSHKCSLSSQCTYG